MKVDTGRLKFEKQRLRIVERDGCGEQMFTVPKLRIDRRIRQATEVQPCPVPEYLSIERRLSIGEGDRKPKLFRVKGTRGCNVGHKKLRFRGKQCRTSRPRMAGAHLSPAPLVRASSTLSRAKLPTFWLGGNSRKVARNCATYCCAGTITNKCSARQRG